jgi:uncharacterized membrane protein
MPLDRWLLVAHIAGAAVWIGGGVMLSVIGLRARRSTDVAAVGEFARLISYAGLRVLMPAVVVVLVSGLWMVLTGSAWSLTQLWIILALIAFAAAFVIGAVFLSRSALRLERVASESPPDLEVAHAAIGRWLTGYAVVLAILAFVLWDMVFKPGL